MSDEKKPETPEAQAESAAFNELDKLAKRIKATTDRLGDVSDAVKVIPSIEAYGKKTRSLTLGMIAGWVLDIALTIVLAVVGINAHDTAAQLKTVEYNSCLQGNVKNLKEIKVWHKLFTLSGDGSRQPGESTAQYDQTQKLLAEFFSYLDQTYAPTNCAQKYLEAGS